MKKNTRSTKWPARHERDQTIADLIKKKDWTRQIYYIGMDPSFSCTGVMILGPYGEVINGFRAFGPESSLYPGQEAQRAIRQAKNIYQSWGLAISEINLIANKKPVLLVYGIEYPLVTRLGKGEIVHQAFMSCCICLGDHIDYCTINNKERIYTVSPNQVKSFIGVRSKELIIKEVFKKYGFDTDDNNLADALVVAHLARWLFFNDLMQEDF